MLEGDKIKVAQGENPCYLLLDQANRHGLIAGASGTGKTVTMKVLAEGFNMMVEDLKIYMKDLVYQQQLLRNAELKAMQAQIRPHFLYNTLESISYLAQMGENSKIKVLAQSLIGLLRMTIGDIRSTITLEEELEGVRQYINIQNIRYGNTLRESIYAEPEIMECKILKLLLQPIVENAIIHGIAPLSHRE